MPDLRLARLLAYVNEDGRVSPMPSAWVRLHELLGPDAPPPLILAAWHYPALWKIIRLQEHIRYAAEHDSLDRVDRFLRSLRPEEWFCIPRAEATSDLTLR